MSDDSDEETQEPAVELGEGETVNGAPLARVASRLTWPKKQSEVVAKEGETTIRTPDGGTTLADALSGVNVAYFESRKEFTDAVFDAVGRGPVETE
jgi:hypothetical protein